jgi:hypothetical protein
MGANNMSEKFWIGLVISASLCLSYTSAFAQADLSGLSKLGPPKGEIIGAIVGAAAGVGVVVYLVIPKQKTIEGCVASGDGGLQLTSEKDKHTYVLGSGGGSLQPGQRVTLKGKPGKKHSGTRDFTVKKLIKDEGMCGGRAELFNRPSLQSAGNLEGMNEEIRYGI